jgi:hypothetical protein
MKKTIWIQAAALVALAAAIAGAESVSGSLSVVNNLTHTGPSTLSSAKETFSQLVSWTVTSGDSTNQMNALWHDRRTIAGSTNETIDISGGITNAFGTVLNLTEVKFFVIRPASTNDSTISVGGAAANAFTNWVADATDAVRVRAGGTLILLAPDATGYGVDAGTGDALLVSNDSTNSATYDIYVGGSD